MRQYPVSVFCVASVGCLTPDPLNPYNPLFVYNHSDSLPFHGHPVGHLVMGLAFGKSLHIFAKCPAKILASFLVFVSSP